MKKFAATILALLTAPISTPSAAFDAVADVKVTQIEITYMPDHIVFWADGAVGTCAAGSLLEWFPRNATQSGRDQNAQAVLAALMTAKSTGASVRLFIINTGCQVEFIYLL